MLEHTIALLYNDINEHVYLQVGSKFRLSTKEQLKIVPELDVLQMAGHALIGFQK